MEVTSLHNNETHHFFTKKCVTRGKERVIRLMYYKMFGLHLIQLPSETLPFGVGGKTMNIHGSFQLRPNFWNEDFIIICNSIYIWAIVFLFIVVLSTFGRFAFRPQLFIY